MLSGDVNRLSYLSLANMKIAPNGELNNLNYAFSERGISECFQAHTTALPARPGRRASSSDWSGFRRPGRGLRGFRPMDEPGPMPVLTSSAGPTSNGSLGLDPARSGLPETAGDWQLII